MSIILEAALQYAHRGWPVIPIHGINEDGRCDCGAMSYEMEVPGYRRHNPGKHPYVEHEHKDASLDPNQIELWWKLYPNANVAIATGWKSGILVVDVDAAHFGDAEYDGYRSLRQLEQQYFPLPPTLQARSGGGGLHYYFEYPKGLDLRSRRGMRPSIDVRSADTVIVAPPSRHMNGDRYEWITPPEMTEIARLPDWLLKVIQTKNAPQKKAGRKPAARKKVDRGGWFL